MKIFGIKIVKEMYLPIIIIIVAIIVEKILKKLLKKFFDLQAKNKKADLRKLATLKSMLNNIIRYIVWIIAVLSILKVFGVNTTALITGLGVLSFVVGLAFQDILKDILAGSSILFENLFGVGDLVKIGTFEGTVISIGLKTTKIKAFTGEVKMIANRNITEVINYSVDNTIAIVDIPISYDVKIEKAEKVLNVTSATLKEKINDLVSEPELLGVQELADSAVVFRISGKCKPGKHASVARLMKKEYKNSLDKAGISIPYNIIEVHNEK